MERMGDNETGSILKGILQHDDGRYVLCFIADAFSFRASKKKKDSFGRHEDERIAEELRDASVR
jgi:hypothetical protein